MTTIHKLITPDTLPQRLPGQKWVLTNGCFDLLHVGHVRYLQAARARGDVLMVGLNSDRSVRALKGPERPVNSELNRAEVLAALSCVDWVTIFSELTADHLLEIVRPDLYVKAGDYTLDSLPEKNTLLRLGIEVAFMPFSEGHSTTALMTRIKT
jgi:rfaE bifunctional protein nucleotidyltransferase chain/domain